MRVALVLFPGVSVDECEAFTMAFERLPDCELIGVGAEPGHVVGPGGRRHVDRSFAELTDPDVVLVPGGLGVERTAHDDALLAWLRAVEPTCQWIAASSTGTVVVAAAGLLGERPAATHWLAGKNLAERGSQASSERIVEVGHVLTCHGRISAMDVALLMILRLHNRETARRVQAELAHERPVAEPRRPSVFERLAARLRIRRSDRVAVRPRNEELDTSAWIEMELVEETETRR